MITKSSQTTVVVSCVCLVSKRKFSTSCRSKSTRVRDEIMMMEHSHFLLHSRVSYFAIFAGERDIKGKIFKVISWNMSSNWRLSVSLKQLIGEGRRTKIALISCRRVSENLLIEFRTECVECRRVWKVQEQKKECTFYSYAFYALSTLSLRVERDI